MLKMAIFPPVLRISLQSLLLAFCVALTACSGGSSDSSDTDPSIDRSVTPDTGSNDGGTPTDEETTPPDTETPTPDPVGFDQPYDRPIQYAGVASMPLQYITTSTGKRLGVYVSFPASEDGEPAEGPFPVIMVQSAYNLSISASSLTGGGSILTGAPDPFLIKRGYAVVSVDALGTGVSEGGWELLGAAEQQAYGEAVDWVEQQPWFNGRLGLAGVSYMGISALYTAQQRPDSVHAIFADVPMGDSQRGTVGIGGTFNALFMSTWMILTHALTTQNIPAALLNPSLYSIIAGATREHINQIDSYYLPLLDDAFYGEDYLSYDGEFWRTRSPIHQIDKVKAPTFITGALQDIFQRDAGLLYEKLKQNTDTRLIIYDGDHTNHVINLFPGGSNSDPLMNLMLQWFDHYLLGMDTGIETIPPVTQYVKNANPLLGYGYASTTDWPHPEAAPERWYLHGDKTLSRYAPETAGPTDTMTTPPFAELEYYKNSNGSLLVFNVKINDGTDCSIGYRQWTLGGGAFIAGDPLNPCFYENSQIEANALNYDSAPMDEDYYINGPIQADIWVSTTARDAVLSVRVDEVSTETGRVTSLSNGLLLATARAVDEQRSRYLQGEMIQPYHYLTKETVQPVEPGEVIKMQVEIFPTSALIRKGNKLRVSLSPSNQAQGVLNYPQRERAKDGITTIHNSPEYPSSLVVPVVPLSALE